MQTRLNSRLGGRRGTLGGGRDGQLLHHDDRDPSGAFVGRVHSKGCPVILHVEAEERWLRGETDDVCNLATAFPSQLIRVS